MSTDIRAQDPSTYIISSAPNTPSSSEGGGGGGSNWPGPSFLLLQGGGEIKYEMEPGIQGSKIIGRYNKNLLSLVTYADEVGKDKIFLKAEHEIYKVRVEKLRAEVSQATNKLNKILDHVKNKGKNPGQNSSAGTQGPPKDFGSMAANKASTSPANNTGNEGGIWSKTKADISAILKKSGLLQQDTMAVTDFVNALNEAPKSIRASQVKNVSRDIGQTFAHALTTFVRIGKTQEALEKLKEEIEELGCENFQLRRECAKYSGPPATAILEKNESSVGGIGEEDEDDSNPTGKFYQDKMAEKMNGSNKNIAANQL